MHDELLLHQDFLERLARRLVRDEASAGDLVQDTWLQALARPPRDRGALRAWLATVARRLAREGLRTGIHDLMACSFLAGRSPQPLPSRAFP